MSKKHRGYKKGFTLPLAVIGGLAAGVAPAIQSAMSGDFNLAARDLLYSYTGIGIDNQFSLEGLKRGLIPLAAGVLIHKFVGGSPINVNRVLANAGVPFIRI